MAYSDVLFSVAFSVTCSGLSWTAIINLYSSNDIAVTEGHLVTAE